MFLETDPDSAANERICDLQRAVGAWRLLVSESEDGAINGFLGSSLHPSFSMIVPGLAADEETAVALLWKALDDQPGKTLIFLAPSAATKLVRTAYMWGARNIELHVAQSNAPLADARGIVFPTFIPETA